MRSCVCHFFVVTLQPKVAKLMGQLAFLKTFILK